MTPEGRAKRALREAYAGDVRRRLAPDALENLMQAIIGQIRNAVAEERGRVSKIVRLYLLYDSQRAVSWHEVQDCLAAIRKEP